MDREDILNILKGYSQEIEAMLPRFTKSHNGLHIDRNDGNRFRDIGTEFLNQLNPNNFCTYIEQRIHCGQV